MNIQIYVHIYKDEEVTVELRKGGGDRYVVIESEKLLEIVSKMGREGES